MPEEVKKKRLTDVGPHDYHDYLPPMVKKNYGKWAYHEIMDSGTMVHVAENGDKLYTVRVGYRHRGAYGITASAENAGFLNYPYGLFSVRRYVRPYRVGRA